MVCTAVYASIVYGVWPKACCTCTCSLAWSLPTFFQFFHLVIDAAICCSGGALGTSQHYTVLTGGDDQALHVATLCLTLSQSAAGDSHCDIAQSEMGSIAALGHLELTASRTVPGAHSAAVKVSCMTASRTLNSVAEPLGVCLGPGLEPCGCWLQGVWVSRVGHMLSLGQDQRLHSWQPCSYTFEDTDRLRPAHSAVLQVLEPAAMAVSPRAPLRLVAVGRGTQVLHVTEG